MTQADAPPRAVHRYAGTAAALSAGALGLVSPPVGLAELGWVVLAPLLVVLASARPAGERFRLGWLAGSVAVLSLFWWVARTLVYFGGLPWVVGLALLGAYCVVFGLPYGVAGMAVAPLRRRFGVGWVVAFASVWVAAEWLQPAIFPYFQGSLQYRRPWVWQLASVFGPYGVSWLLLLVNGLVAEVWLRWREGRPFPVGAVAVAGALLAGNLAFGAWRHAAVEAVLREAPVARVGFWQARRYMTRPAARGVEILPPLLATTRALAREGAQVVVWPEGALFPTPDLEPQRTMLAEAARASGAMVVLGANTRRTAPDAPGGVRDHNSAWVFGGDGSLVGHYDKMRLLAFGEQLPAWVEPLRPWLSGAGAMAAGQEVVVFDAGEFRFTTPICYEAIVEPQVRAMADADVLLNLTNDAWFGHTSEPHQHAMLAAAAAMQFGRPLVRVAYTGISEVVEPHGEHVGETPTFTETTGVLPVRVATVDTVWRTWGRHFPLVNTLVAAVLTALAVRRRS